MTIMAKKDSKKRVHNLIIVDESGSMSIIRKQAFVGMNETLQTVRKMQEKFPDIEQKVTLITFDSERIALRQVLFRRFLASSLDCRPFF